MLVPFLPSTRSVFSQIFCINILNRVHKQFSSISPLFRFHAKRASFEWKERKTNRPLLNSEKEWNKKWRYARLGKTALFYWNLFLWHAIIATVYAIGNGMCSKHEKYHISKCIKFSHFQLIQINEPKNKPKNSECAQSNFSRCNRNKFARSMRTN